MDEQTDLSFKRIEDSKHASLWRVDTLEVYLRGEKIGRLAISYVPSERVAKWKEDVYEFLAERGSGIGIYIKLPWNDNPDVLGSDASQIHAMVDGRRRASDANWKAQPREAIIAALDSWRPKVAEMLKPKIDDFVGFHVDKPLVDFIEIETEHRGKGIGLALYQEGAAWMAERGFHLHASGVQSKAAEWCWKALERRGIVDTVPHVETNKTRRILRAKGP